MTRAVGGLFRNASGSTGDLAQAAFASMSAAVAGQASDSHEEDEESEGPTMDMTMAVGGILRASALAPATTLERTPVSSAVLTHVGSGAGSAAGRASLGDPGSADPGTPAWLKQAADLVAQPPSSHASRGAATTPAATTPAAVPDGAGALPSDDEDDEADAMEFTGAYPLHAVAEEASPLADPAEAEADPAEAEVQPTAPQPPVQPAALAPAPAADLSRRKSLSGKIAELSSRVWRYAASTAEPAADEPPPTHAQAPPPTQPPPPPPTHEAEATASSSDDGAVQPPKTFDEYLARADVHFLAGSSTMGGGRTSLGQGMASLLGAPLASDEQKGGSHADQLIAASVLDADLSQLQWAGQELVKCIGVLKDGYSQMEKYIADNYDGFFAAEETQIEPKKLLALRSRCRQTAHSLWYDWRQTLEKDTALKLRKIRTMFEAELAEIENLCFAADEIEAMLAAAMPPSTVSGEAAAAALAAREAANALALKQHDVSRSQSALFALQQQLVAAEAELVRAKDAHRAKQTRLSELSAAVAATVAGPSAESRHGDVLVGDALVEALEAGAGWKPLTLTSSVISVGFETPTAYELRVSLAPGAPAAHAVASAHLFSYDSAEAADDRPAHLVVRAGLFGRLSRHLAPQLAGLRATTQLPRLMRQVALNLGRLAELAREVETLEQRVPVSAALDVDGRGVAVSIGYSFFTARAKFVLHLLLGSLDPSEPLEWQLDVDELAPELAPALHPSRVGTPSAALTAAPLRARVGAIVDAHSCGFGRLTAIHSDLVKAFCSPQ